MCRRAHALLDMFAYGAICTLYTPPNALVCTNKKMLLQSSPDKPCYHGRPGALNKKEM